MGIDKIGKGGLPEISGAGGAQGARPVGRSFAEVHAEKASAAEAPSAVEVRSPLERLRAGEIDMRGYIDARVDHATSALKGLPASQLETIRKALREQLATDPALGDLVRRATGRTAEVPEEE